MNFRRNVGSFLTFGGWMSELEHSGVLNYNTVQLSAIVLELQRQINVQG